MVGYAAGGAAFGPGSSGFTGYAASGDTWGISGPTFLVLFGLAAVIAAVRGRPGTRRIVHGRVRVRGGAARGR